MLNNNYFAYTSYLRKRSLLGYLYRKFWLYPGLSKFINGKCIDIGCGIGDFLSFNNGIGFSICSITLSNITVLLIVFFSIKVVD